MKVKMFNDDYLSFIDNKHSAYRLIVTNERDYDYKLISASFKLTNYGYGTYIPTKFKETKIERIYRIVENFPATQQTGIYDDGAILLYHGTKRENVQGILNVGFISSSREC